MDWAAQGASELAVDSHAVLLSLSVCLLQPCSDPLSPTQRGFFLLKMAPQGLSVPHGHCFTKTTFLQVYFSDHMLSYFTQAPSEDQGGKTEGGAVFIGPKVVLTKPKLKNHCIITITYFNLVTLI